MSWMRSAPRAIPDLPLASPDRARALHEPCRWAMSFAVSTLSSSPSRGTTRSDCRLSTIARKRGARASRGSGSVFRASRESSADSTSSGSRRSRRYSPHARQSGSTRQASHTPPRARRQPERPRQAPCSGPARAGRGTKPSANPRAWQARWVRACASSAAQVCCTAVAWASRRQTCRECNTHAPCPARSLVAGRSARGFLAPLS